MLFVLFFMLIVNAFNAENVEKDENSNCPFLIPKFQNESSLVVEIPAYVTTDDTRDPRCSYEYHFQDMTSLDAVLDNSQKHACAFDVELRTGIGDIVAILPCNESVHWSIPWQGSIVVISLPAKGDNSISFRQPITLHISIEQLPTEKGEFQAYNKTPSDYNVDDSTKPFDIHSIISPLAACVSVGIIGCLLVCVRYKRQYGFVRAASRRSIEQLDINDEETTDRTGAGCRSVTSGWMWDGHTLPLFYNYVYQMNKSLYPLPTDPPPPYPGIQEQPGQTTEDGVQPALDENHRDIPPYLNLNQQSYPMEPPPSYELALSMIETDTSDIHR